MKERRWYRYWASAERAARQEAAETGPGDGVGGVGAAAAASASQAGRAPDAAAEAPTFHVEPEEGATAEERPGLHVDPGLNAAADAPAAFQQEQVDEVPGEGPLGFHVERIESGADAAVEAPPTFHVEPAETSEAPSPVPREPDAEDERQSATEAAPDDDETLDPSFQRARVLTIANQKGGVGKTTTAVSLAAALADVGARVLLVDLDPQGNASSGVGVRVRDGQATIYDVLVGDTDMADAIEPTSVRNLFVVPATIDLAGAEIELVSAFSREQKLRRALESVRADFDIVLIDCPPSLGLLTVNAVSAADGIVVPIQCEYYALEGLGALQRNAELIKENLNPDLTVTGYVMTMMDGRTRLSQQVVEEVVSHFGDRVFATRIPRSVRLAEAPSYGQPITVFDPSSRGARAYRSLAREILRRLRDDEPAGVGA